MRLFDRYIYGSAKWRRYVWLGSIILDMSCSLGKYYRFPSGVATYDSTGVCKGRMRICNTLTISYVNLDASSFHNKAGEDRLVGLTDTTFKSQGCVEAVWRGEYFSKSSRPRCIELFQRKATIRCRRQLTPDIGCFSLKCSPSEAAAWLSFSFFYWPVWRTKTIYFSLMKVVTCLYYEYFHCWWLMFVKYFKSQPKIGAPL